MLTLDEFKKKCGSNIGFFLLNVRSLCDLPIDFRDDYEIIFTSVSQDGESLKYASPRLRSNRDIVLAAVRQNGNAIMFASPIFDDDKEIILTAWESAPPGEMGDFSHSKRDIIVMCMSRRLREDPDINPGVQIDNTLNWHNKILQKLAVRLVKKDLEKHWQKNFEVAKANRFNQWKHDCVQWEKNHEYNNYKVLRAEIDRMPKYKIWKQQVFAKYGKLCEICGATNNLETHHRKSLYSIIKQKGIKDKYQAFECTQLWDFNNGAVLCSECHARMESSQTSKN